MPPAILFAPSLFNGQLLWGGDIETLEFAFKTAARRSLAAGEWPLWMPELLGGMPGIAASTSETFELAGAPNFVDAPENNLEFEVTWA